MPLSSMLQYNITNKNPKGRKLFLDFFLVVFRITALLFGELSEAVDAAAVVPTICTPENDV